MEELLDSFLSRTNQIQAKIFSFLKRKTEIINCCFSFQVQPSVMSNRNGLWSYNAVAEFDKYFSQYTYPMMAVAQVRTLLELALGQNYVKSCLLRFELYEPNFISTIEFGFYFYNLYLC